MNILHLDFETYYDREYTLKKMTMVEYIMDARFQPIILSYAWNNEPVQRLYGFKQMKEFVDSVDWTTTLVNAQNCVTGDHEVFTPNGWVRFDELDDNTEVMQWDVTTGKGTFVKPNFVVRKPYKGVMYKSDTLYHKGIYTPSHRFVFDTPSSKQGWRFEVAEKVAKRQPNQIYIPVGINYEVDNPLELDHNLIRFIEATRADGYVDPKTFAISFHFSKQRKIDRLLELAELLDMKTTFKYNPSSGSTQIRCYGDKVDYVKNLLGHKKTLCWEWVKSLSLANRVTWLEELRHWDGHSNSSFTTTVHSAKKEEIQLLEMMAQISGCQSYASYDNPNTRGWSKPDGVLHQLTVRNKQRVKLIERPEKIQFDGMVYCVNVPTGAFLVRRQGKSWVTGNCQFDGSILALRFGKTARAYTDTMAMARVTGAHVIAGGASLEKIAELLISLGYPIPPKGKEVASASGKRLYNGWVEDKPFYLAEERTNSTVEMNKAVELLDAYGQYCDNDVELARQAFNYFRTLISPQEMAFGDMILKCYIQPQFYLDEQIIREEIVRIEHRDKEKIQAVADTYFGGDVNLMRNTMRSVPKFTAFLQSIGGELTYEFGPYYHPEEYRFEIPYKFSEKKGINQPCYAKTHPQVIDILEGDDEELATIFQMKLALTSSIERTRAERFLSISQLRCGFGMPYSVSGAHTHRLGGCVVADTKIIVKSADRNDGKPRLMDIDQLRSVDLVWDGDAWCKHDGLVYKGKQTVNMYQGLWATDDHIVFATNGEMVEFGYAMANNINIKNARLPKHTHNDFKATANKVNSKVIREAQLELELKYVLLPENTSRVMLSINGFYETLYKQGAIPFRVFRQHVRESSKGLTVELCGSIKPRTAKVYDILNCGRKNRFWANGKLIHNSGGLNVQNLSSGRKAGQSKALKRSITAPDGHVVVCYDASQIEARVLAYVAGDMPYLQVFIDKQDPYSVLASQIYGGDPAEIKRLAKADVEPYSNIQRPAGKAGILGCLTEDCEVLCKRGWVNILDITPDDLVWNGIDYVPHTGVVYQGEKEVTNLGMTPDHLVFNGTEWEQSKDVDITKALEWASGNLPDTMQGD